MPRLLLTSSEAYMSGLSIHGPCLPGICGILPPVIVMALYSYGPIQMALYSYGPCLSGGVLLPVIVMALDSYGPYTIM